MNYASPKSQVPVYMYAFTSTLVPHANIADVLVVLNPKSFPVDKQATFLCFLLQSTQG